jgi:hypothetical protein
MKLTSEEAKSVVWEDNEDWKPESVEVIEETSRWSVFKSRVFEHLASGKFYEFDWSEGATECQDESPYEYDKEYTPREVVKKEVTSYKWVSV